ncbi:hypothetical protein D9M70_587950 [compost metagenome]
MLFQQGSGKRLLEHTNARFEQAVALAVVDLAGCLEAQCHGDMRQLAVVADDNQIPRASQR